MELNIHYSTLLCAFYLHVVSLGRKLQTLLIDMCLYLSAKEGYFCVYPHVHNYMYIHVHCNQYTGKEDGVVESCVQVHIYS